MLLGVLRTWRANMSTALKLLRMAEDHEVHLARTLTLALTLTLPFSNPSPSPNLSLLV